MRNKLATAVFLTIIIMLIGACAPQSREVNAEPEGSTDVSDEMQASIDDASGESGEEDETGTERIPFNGLLDRSENEENVPEGWPDYVPVHESFVLLSTFDNKAGGLYATFGSTTTLDEIEEYYKDALSDWEDGETIPEPFLSDENFRFMKYRDGDTVQIEGVATESDPPTISIEIAWNWYSAPGTPPDGWKDDIPIMTGLEIFYGFIDGNGYRNLVLSGTGELESVASWYLANLDGWTRIDRAGLDPVLGESLVMNFQKDMELMAFTGHIFDGKMYIWIKRAEFPDQ